MRLEAVAVDKPDDVDVLIGQAHVIKTVDDPHEALARERRALLRELGYKL